MNLEMPHHFFSSMIRLLTGVVDQGSRAGCGGRGEGGGVGWKLYGFHTRLSAAKKVPGKFTVVGEQPYLSLRAKPSLFCSSHKITERLLNIDRQKLGSWKTCQLTPN